MTSSNNIQKWLLVGAAPAILMVVAFATGAYLFSAPKTESESTLSAQGKSEHDNTTWTCSMHPSVQMLEPGKCPICLMDLIALARTAGSGAQVSLRPDVIDLLAIETRPVVRQGVVPAGPGAAR
ncbi:MAG: hypothetical protein OSB10_10160, partial [Planctomycetota bacterium]|nr:hypothetical protein [Planctomycetota bacterium]